MSLNKYKEVCNWQRKSIHPLLNKLIGKYNFKLIKRNSCYRLELPCGDWREYESLGSASEIAINRAVEYALTLPRLTSTTRDILAVFPELA